MPTSSSRRVARARHSAAGYPNNAAKYVRQQREEQGRLNAGLRDTFAARGIAFNEVDQAAFRARLPGVYVTWKDKLGNKCWSLLEAEVGKLG